MYQIEVQNDQGEWELKLTCSEGLVSSHVELYKSIFKGDIRVVNLNPPGVNAPAKRVITPEEREELLSPCFNGSRVRGLQSICDETGLPPEDVDAWVEDKGGQVLYCDHKDRQRFLCKLPTIGEIPNIFDFDDE